MKTFSMPLLHGRKLIYCFLLATVATAGIRCSDDDKEAEPEQPVKSVDRKIVSFSFSGLKPDTTTVKLDEATRTITATVQEWHEIEYLIPTIVISDKASISPASGTAQDFSVPVKYVVTAEDGSQATYTVNVSMGKRVCMPSSGIPMADGTLYIMQTDATLHAIQMTFEPYDKNDTIISTKYEYTDGNVTRIDGRLGINDLGRRYYTTVEYQPTFIVERYYTEQYHPGEPESAYYLHSYTTYHRKDNRITSWATRWNNTSIQDSVTLAYDTRGNVIRMDNYGKGNTIVHSTLYEYDEFMNPIHWLGLLSRHRLIFQPYNISRHNPLKITEYEKGVEVRVRNLRYTYAFDLPWEMFIDGTQTYWRFTTFCE